MNERLSKQDLKADPLMKHTGEVVDFAQHHVRILLGGAALLLVAVVAVVFIRAAGGRAEDRAAGMLAEARGDLAKGNPDAAAARLNDILEFHGGTSSGKQALLLNADIRFNQGRYDEALTYYERATRAFSKDPLLGPAARRGLAAALESQGDHTRAVELLEALYRDAPPVLVHEEVGLDLARNYVKLGRDDEAAKIYEDVSRTPDNPRVAQSAKELLAELRAMRAAG